MESTRGLAAQESESIESTLWVVWRGLLPEDINEERAGKRATLIQNEVCVGVLVESYHILILHCDDILQHTIVKTIMRLGLLFGSFISRLKPICIGICSGPR